MNWPSEEFIPAPLYSIGSICGYNQIYSFHGFLYAPSTNGGTGRLELRITQEIHTNTFVISIIYIY